ncbi:MAG: shikimate kinase [Bacteroidales bacterium]|nr:shikimate kinase [Bacteroidales bacterium]
MERADKIYLIGFMGSGKSTAGKKLAAGLDWDFIDLDKRIEQETGLTIPEIFLRYGEQYFRETETRLLRELEPVSRTVVSTGGGAPCSGDNMDFMLGTGLAIYLKLTPRQLSVRLSESKGERPLIKNISKEKLPDYISEKLSQREKYYSRAAITVDGTYTDFETIISLVKKHFNS